MHTDLERKHQTLPQQPSTAEEVPLKLFLLRHGETEWNQTGRFQGITDVPLDPAGRRQADALSLSLRDEPLCAVYASPLSRARETAERVARPHGLAVQTVADLREMDLGELEGVDRDTFLTRFAAVASRWRESAWTVQMPGGESLPEVQKRMWRAVQQIVGRHAGGSVVAVAHNFANAVTLCKAAGLDISEYRQFRQSAAAKNLIEFQNGMCRVVLVNDVSHLSAEADRV